MPQKDARRKITVWIVGLAWLISVSGLAYIYEVNF